MRRTVWTIAGLVLVGSAVARAETTQWVTSPTIQFHDVVPEASGRLAALDLGPAPPPGGSRLFSLDDLRTAAILAHADISGVTLPPGVRVVRASRRYTDQELESLVRPALLAALPVGAAVIALHLPKSLLSVPDLQVGTIRISRLPKHPGATRVTPVAELTSNGATVARLAVAVDLQLDERAARYTLERGATLELVIDTGSARISATAAVMAPADVGDIVPCQVLNTRKVLRARIISRAEASVVQP